MCAKQPGWSSAGFREVLGMQSTTLNQGPSNEAMSTWAAAVRGHLELRRHSVRDAVRPVPLRCQGAALCPQDCRGGVHASARAPSLLCCLKEQEEEGPMT